MMSGTLFIIAGRYEKRIRIIAYSISINSVLQPMVW